MLTIICGLVRGFFELHSFNFPSQIRWLEHHVFGNNSWAFLLLGVQGGEKSMSVLKISVLRKGRDRVWLLCDSYTAKLRRVGGNIERRLACSFVRSLQTENLEQANDPRVQFYNDCVRREFYSYVKDLKQVPISCRFTNSWRYKTSAFFIAKNNVDQFLFYGEFHNFRAN